MSHSLENLKRHILPRSKASDFDMAKREWDLLDIEISEVADSCPCGQAIHDICHIRNRETGEVTYVGNVCINKFIGVDTQALFAGFKKIRKCESANMNAELIHYASSHGLLYPREEEFLYGTARKRNLSLAQLKWKRDINRRVIRKITQARDLI